MVSDYHSLLSVTSEATGGLGQETKLKGEPYSRNLALYTLKPKRMFDRSRTVMISFLTVP